MRTWRRRTSIVGQVDPICKLYLVRRGLVKTAGEIIQYTEVDCPVALLANLTRLALVCFLNYQ